MKKLFQIGFWASVGVLCGMFGACTPDDNVLPEEVKSLTLSEETVSVNVYDDFTLETTLNGLSGEVTWSSSDNGVVIVENGKILAVETGTATVTAELNGYEDTCSVTVHNNLMRMPTLETGTKEIAFEKNDEYTVTVDLLYNGVSVPKDYEYVWTVKSGDEGVVSVTSINGTNGSQVKIKALDYGTAECYVMVNAVGREIVDVVNVTVLPATPSIFLTNFSQEQGEYSINLSSIDANNGIDVSTVIPEVTVIEDGKTIENPSLVWSEGESKIAVIEEGKIKAVGVGSTTFALTYKQSKVNVKVNVYRPTISIDETLEFETAIPTITYESKLIGTGEKVYLKDNEVGTITNQTITCDLSNTKYVLGEETTATLWTDKVIYECKAVVYTKVINTTAEFQKISTDYDPIGVSMGGYTYRQGYYVLGADLDFGGKTHRVCNFMGTFDGRGHTVSNMYLQKAGLFGYLRESAVIKNVIIKSAVLDVSGNAGVVARQAFNGFTISNVYAEAKYVGTIATSGSFGAGFIGQKLYNGYSENHSIEDCVMIVDVSGLTANGEATASCFVGFVQHNPTLCAEGKVHQNSEIFNLNNSIALVVGEDSDGNTVSSYYGSQSFTATSASPYVYPVLTDSPVFRGLEEYQEWADGDTSDYKAEALRFIGDYVQENLMTVALETDGHPDVNMYNAVACITLTDLVLKGSENEKLTLSNQTIQSLKLDAEELLGNIATISTTGVLTLTSPTNCLVNELGIYRGQTCLVLTALGTSGSDKGKTFVYTIPITLADYVITTYTEFRQLSSYLVETNTLPSKQNTMGTTTVWTNGYFVLGQDIDFDGKQIVDTTNAKRVSLSGGSFDGQGYTMTAPIFYNNAMFEYIRDGAQIKNVKIVNAGVHFGANASIVARMASKGFTVSNVYAEVKFEKTPSSYRFGLIGRHYAGGTNDIIQDCTVVGSVTALKGATGVSVGLFIGDNTDSDNKNASTSTRLNYGKVTIKNCIGIITDTNENGYTISGNVGSIFDTEHSGSKQENSGFYADWNAYDFATLSGYNAEMLAFIADCKE